jgi:hypothetical protein
MHEIETLTTQFTVDSEYQIQQNAWNCIADVTCKCKREYIISIVLIQF